MLANPADSSSHLSPTSAHGSKSQRVDAHASEQDAVVALAVGQQVEARIRGGPAWFLGKLAAIHSASAEQGSEFED
jgi:hypothetical protein